MLQAVGVGVSILPAMFFPGSASALGITYNLENRDALTATFAPDTTSYDRPEFNAFTPFAGIVDPTLAQLHGFSVAGSAELTVTMIAERGWFDGKHLTVGNTFGFVDGNGQYVSFLDKDANPGDSASLTLSQGNYNFAISSPEGLFFDDDEKNLYNGQPNTQMLAMRVVKDTIMTIQNADLFGASIILDLHAGDLILAFEDLRSGCNLNVGNGLTCTLTDADFNDGLLLVRSNSAPVPEPGTMMLLSSGLFGFVARRRRR